MAMIDAILFDVGRVLIEWDPRHLYRKLLPDDEAVERFLRDVCTLEWHFAHDQGKSFEENAAPLKEAHPNHAELIDLWGARYLEMSPGEVEGMSDLMDRAEQAGVEFHGLSNMPSSIYPRLKSAFRPIQRLRTIVVSGDEKVCKPDLEIFHLAIGRMGTDPARTLFVDDSAINVEAGAKVGLLTHHFKSATGLETHLEELGVLGAD
ncbi:MAG: HAD-IA family hydrolase [Rhodobiaceae bacterium]|nr:HAD-IA family hydrolase [Rhodobiaceae bacterium]